jgi:hypothetical protein
MIQDILYAAANVGGEKTHDWQSDFDSSAMPAHLDISFTVLLS